MKKTEVKKFNTKNSSPQPSQHAAWRKIFKRISTRMPNRLEKSCKVHSVRWMLIK